MRIQTIDSSYVWLQRGLDIAVPLLLLYSIVSLYGVAWHDRYTAMGLLGGLTLVLFNQATGVYRNWRSLSLYAGSMGIVRAWILTWMLLIVLAFLLKDAANYSRFSVSLWALTTPAGLILYRILIHLLLTRIRERGWNTRRVAIVGAGNLGQRITGILSRETTLGYRPIAYYDDATEKTGKIIQGIPVAGTIDELLHRTDLEKVYDEIYITPPLRAEQRIKHILSKLTDNTVVVKFIPDLFGFDLLHASWTDIRGMPVISIYDSPFNTMSAWLIKRMEDMLLAGLILLLTSPLMLALAAGVKLSSPGPVIFKQKRYGLNGKEINVYKFRSMITQDNGSVVPQARKNDPRVTPIGAFMRRTSLDELPQFYNVLQGRMSVVGPRPHACAHNEQYRKLVPQYMQRHLIKPGITGWAQINGWRGETDTLEKMEMRIEHDLHYINNWSLWLDLRIVIMTVLNVFSGRNAY